MNSKMASIILKYFKKGQTSKIKEAAKILGFKSKTKMWQEAHMKAPRMPIKGKGTKESPYTFRRNRK